MNMGHENEVQMLNLMKSYNPIKWSQKIMSET